MPARPIVPKEQAVNGARRDPEASHQTDREIRAAGAASAATLQDRDAILRASVVLVQPRPLCHEYDNSLHDGDGAGDGLHQGRGHGEPRWHIEGIGVVAPVDTDERIRRLSA
jgi:hypothetical protein